MGELMRQGSISRRCAITLTHCYILLHVHTKNWSGTVAACRLLLQDTDTDVATWGGSLWVYPPLACNCREPESVDILMFDS